MLFEDHLCLLRGGGDLATGVALRLHRCGFPVAVCELENPLTVRRTVAVSTAVTAGEITVEGMSARRVDDLNDVATIAATGVVPVLVSPQLPDLGKFPRSVVVDARLMKLNTDTTLEDAPLVVALGPGYTAGMDCHIVVETLRGPRIGRVITIGTASPDTGVPGEVEGQSTKRVIRAPADGLVIWNHQIGDRVEVGDVLGHVGAHPVVSDLTGMVRGLVADGTSVRSGTKVGDVDPRGSRATIEEVSDKALAVGGGVLEAVLSWLDNGQ